MYSKTSLGADQASVPQLSARAKRILLAAGGLIVAACVAVGVWSAVGTDSYGPSANGCVNVTIAQTMGGSTLHYCGDDAKSFCRSAYARSDQISLFARPQCAQAGLTQAKVSAG